MTDRPIQDRKRLERSVIVSAILAALGYVGFSLWAGWGDVTAALITVGASGMALVFALSLLNYGLRFLRWQAYLSALGHPMPTTPSVAIYISGFAFTTSPGKAGELMRGLFLARYGVPMTRTAAAFLSERLSDIVAVVLISLPGLAILPRGWPVVVAGLAGIAAVATALGFGDQLNRLAIRLDAEKAGSFHKLARKLALLLHEARRCHHPGTTLIATFLSIFAWSAEAVAFYVILRLIGFDPGLWYAICVYALAILAGAISFLPGGLGGTEAVMVAMLTLRDAPEPMAVAATILIRLATLWFAVVLGLLTILFSGKWSPRSAKQAKP